MFQLPGFPKGNTQETPGSPLPANMYEWERGMWEQWWRPQLPRLGLAVTELAREHMAGFAAWRGRLSSSAKGAPFPDWPALPASRNWGHYRNAEVITQSSCSELLQLLMAELFFVTAVTDLILAILLTTGKTRRPMINKIRFSIIISSFLWEFYVYP